MQNVKNIQITYLFPTKVKGNYENSVDYTTEQLSCFKNIILMVDSWSIFHAENDTANRFLLARHSFEY